MNSLPLSDDEKKIINEKHLPTNVNSFHAYKLRQHYSQRFNMKTMNAYGLSKITVESGILNVKW